MKKIRKVKLFEKSPRKFGISNSKNNYIFSRVTLLTDISRNELSTEYASRVIISLVIGFLISIALSLNFLLTLILTLVGSVMAIYGNLKHRAKLVRKYRESIESEFPEFVESLAIATNSGLSFMSAFVRTCEEYQIETDIRKYEYRNSQGKASSTTERKLKLNFFKRLNLKLKFLNYQLLRREKGNRKSPLQRELSRILAELRVGKSLSKVLDQFSARLGSIVISDFADAVVLTLARGTPLAELLDNHAQTIRENHRRLLLERAGRAEIRMMVPVVFLLLPISVLFVLWPSFQQLQQLVVVS